MPHPDDQPMPFMLNTRQLATTLAALRLYQSIAEGKSAAQALVDIDDIATDGGHQSALTAEETDTLCEDLRATERGERNAGQCG
jgi:hypothetical protein